MATLNKLLKKSPLCDSPPADYYRINFQDGSKYEAIKSLILVVWFNKDVTEKIGIDQNYLISD